MVIPSLQQSAMSMRRAEQVQVRDGSYAASAVPDSRGSALLPPAPLLVTGDLHARAERAGSLSEPVAEWVCSLSQLGAE